MENEPQKNSGTIMLDSTSCLLKKPSSILGLSSTMWPQLWMLAVNGYEHKESNIYLPRIQGEIPFDGHNIKYIDDLSYVLSDRYESMDQYVLSLALELEKTYPLDGRDSGFNIVYKNSKISCNDCDLFNNVQDETAELLMYLTKLHLVKTHDKFSVYNSIVQKNVKNAADYTKVISKKLASHKLNNNITVLYKAKKYRMYVKTSIVAADESLPSISEFCSSDLDADFELLIDGVSKLKGTFRQVDRCSMQFIEDTIHTP